MADKIKGEEVFQKLGAAYIISHPARATIVSFLRKKGKAYPAQISREINLSPRLVTFHLSMLSTGGFVNSEYGLANPSNTPKAVRYYYLTDKVDKVLEDFVSSLKKQ